MVRLRSLGGEFHSPDDFRPGALFTMPYLADMQAYQEYQDGNLDLLFSRMAGNADLGDITGAALYRTAGNGAYWRINFFRAITRQFVGAVFERTPVLLDDDPAAEALWEQHKNAILRAMRLAAAWRVSKGRGVLAVEHRYPNALVPVAYDPAFYVPLVDYVNRDHVLGHVMALPWYDGPRLPGLEYPNKMRVMIYVPEEGARNSDGRIPGAVNEIRNFLYAGNLSGGTIAGRLGEEDTPREANSRLEGMWSFGDDDSWYATAERGVYECILALTNARTALTQDVRATAILPEVVDPQFVDADGNIKVDLLRPQYRIPANHMSMSGSTGFGYVEPPGPMQAEAFLRMYEVGRENLAYDANIPPEAFGVNYTANEPAEAVTKLQQVFKTAVVDTRDDLGVIASQMFAALTGVMDATIGWEFEPFADQKENDDRAIKLKGAGIISTDTAQVMTNTPREAIQEAANGVSDLSVREGG